LASAGRDTLFGGSDADLLSGGGDSDQLSGGSGNDELRGGRGRDVLDGDEGNDLVLGGKGKDVLIDGLGDDILKGAANNDCFLFTDPALIGGQEGTFTDIIFGGTGKDTIYLALSSENYALYADDLMGDAPSDALNALGLTVKGVEYIVVVEGRAGLQILAGEEWYSSADLWGLV
jgi:Ca2+-binding RTX toxin-like protein